MDLYFPIEWDFGDNPSDGAGGDTVEDAGTIYAFDGDFDSDTFESVLYKTTLSDMVDYLIDGHKSTEGEKITEEESIMIVRKLQAAFQKEIDKLESVIES